MATLLWQRDIASDASEVKNTFSSWDSCMAEAYCKWPAIIAIVVGSLIALSLLWCLARCLCCGAECCCGCLACCNACCPSPRGGRRRDGYQQQPPPQQTPMYPNYGQYQSAPPPVYAMSGAGYRGAPVAQTATFDTPGARGGAKYNEDALPPMPSWNTATSRQVENEDVELEKLEQHQQQSLIPKQDNNTYYGHYQQDAAAAGDLGGMHATPYQDHSYEQWQRDGQYQQYAPSSTTSAYPPTYHTTSPVSTMYEPAGQQQQWGGYPPSYHTGAPSARSPPPPQQQYSVPRKAVQGSWRDI